MNFVHEPNLLCDALLDINTHVGWYRDKEGVLKATTLDLKAGRKHIKMFSINDLPRSPLGEQTRSLIERQWDRDDEPHVASPSGFAGDLMIALSYAMWTNPISAVWTLDEYENHPKYGLLKRTPASFSRLLDWDIKKSIAGVEMEYYETSCLGLDFRYAVYSTRSLRILPFSYFEAHCPGSVARITNGLKLGLSKEEVLSLGLAFFSTDSQKEKDIAQLPTDLTGSQ